MSVSTLETDWWSLDLPEEWQASQEDELVVVKDEDEVSCIEVSTLCREQGDVSDADLAELSADLRNEGLSPKAVRIGPWQGEYYCYDDAHEACREWYLRCGGLLLFITCACRKEHAGMDDSAVDTILATLTPRQEEY